LIEDWTSVFGLWSLVFGLRSLNTIKNQKS
jgi:hypothetical protein